MNAPTRQPALARLLIVAQALDTENPVLGFFHGWVAALAARYERVEVICLYEGRHALPGNVHVHSLGKPSSAKATKDREPRLPHLFLRMRYAWRFVKLVWRLRHDYDAVFVHMNQEYVLIAGWLWRQLGKRIYLWRNHYAGSLATDLAATFSTKVFCTSTHSYTAKYKKTILMPVGVDTERFHLGLAVARTPHSILFLARIARSKQPELLIEALALLSSRGVAYTADFVGSPRTEDEAYYEALVQDVRARGLEAHITFRPGVPNAEALALYQGHEIFVNCSPSGMLDKTLFEAAACGCRVLARSEDFAALAGGGSYFDSAATLSDRLEAALAESRPAAVPTFVEGQSLPVLVDRLVEELY